MKKFLFSAAVALAFCGATARAAHVQTGAVRVGPAAEDAADPPAASKPNKEAGKRTSAPDAKPQNEDGNAKPAVLSDVTASTLTRPAAGNTNSTSDAPPKQGAESSVPVGTPVKTATGAEGSSGSSKSAQPAPTGLPSGNSNPSAATPPKASPAPANAAAAPSPASLANIYRIGTGDVLDIRLLNAQDPRQSTLYPVLAGGVLDYPLLRDPLTVAGMTTDELAAQLVAEFRHRGLYERPQVRVSVREYASHAVLVSGLVNDPGTKILRREAIPLYVIVAEAQPRPEAGRAVIVSHSTGKVTNVDLNDAAGLNTLVQTGDVVTLTVRPPEFFYVGGEIASPGQKDFHSGMTLTQALLASGGVTRGAGDRVRVSRQGPDGRLVSTDYNLREIEGGAAPDPVLRAGDRIEVPAGKRK